MRQVIREKRVRILVSVALLLLSLVLPSSPWTPTPEALRFGPIEYDSSISSPRRIPIGGTTQSMATDVRISLEYLVRERPKDYAYLLSTSEGVGEGIKISMDLYGNLYASFSVEGSASDAYQLVKVSDPMPPGIKHKIEIRLSLNQSMLRVKFEDREVPLVEPRPLRSFVVSAIRPRIDLIEIGGSESKNLNGVISSFSLVYGRSNPPIDLINLRMLLALVAMSLLVSVAARVLAKRY